MSTPVKIEDQSSHEITTDSNVTIQPRHIKMH
jgi:hypothetical protein